MPRLIRVFAGHSHFVGFSRAAAHVLEKYNYGPDLLGKGCCLENNKARSFCVKSSEMGAFS